MTYRIAGHRVILPTLAAVAVAAVLPLAIGHAQTSNGQTENTTTGATPTGGAAPTTAATPTGGAACDNDTGITLPPGFCATVFADKLGHAAAAGRRARRCALRQHLERPLLPATTRPRPAASWSHSRTRKTTGTPMSCTASATTPASGGHGGTGIALYKGALYAEINDRIVRYPLCRPARSRRRVSRPRSSPACR